MERHRNKEETRKLHRYEYDLWSGTMGELQWECGLKGIPTKNGVSPDYCGGAQAHGRKSHSIAKNTIVAVNGGSPHVVAFSLKSQLRLKDWRLDMVRKPLHERTAISDVAVGHNACDWHDNDVFATIDDMIRVIEGPADPMVPVLFALRVTLQQYFLAYRHWRLFDRRSVYSCEAAASISVRCPNDCRSRWRADSKDDRHIARQHKRQLDLLRKELGDLVLMVRRRDASQIAGSGIFLPGTPGLGGTLGYNQRIGGGVTCTISPVTGGHYIYVTRHTGMRNALAKLAMDLVMPRMSDVQKGQVISELALQQNGSVFITMPKWRSMARKVDQAKIHVIAEEMHSSPPRKFHVLKDDPRVPNLLA